MSSSSLVVANPSEPIPALDAGTVPTAPVNNNNSNNNMEDEGGSSSKKQKGRFKKLKKRALCLRTDADLSGISKREEWEELKLAITTTTTTTTSLMKEQPQAEMDGAFYPWIGNRTTRKQLLRTNNEERIVEAVDHRMILKRLHCQASLHGGAPLPSKKGKKRPLEEQDAVTNIVVPPWATLHNSACVDHLAILEVHINNSNNQQKQNEISMENVESAIASAVATTAKPMATQWFQGPRPQSISDALLYEKPNHPKSSKKQAKIQSKAESDSNAALMETLQSLSLSPEQCEKEGYPAVQKSRANPQKETNDREHLKEMRTEPAFRQPSSFTLEDAKILVQKAQVYVKEQVFPFVVEDAGATNIHSSPRVFGLDCEMVKTEIGTELARITLIQYTGSQASSTNNSFADSYNVLLDELVLPEHKVLDYVTEYSGVTAQLLKDVTIRLEQIQAALLHYVRKKDIVVGHSLENDLMACRWIHPTVIDTAVLFRSHGTFKHSLKHLSNVLLQKKIQGGSHHCSEEDAATALELAIRRAEEGDSFAIYSKEKQRWIQSGKNDGKGACVFVGPSHWLQGHVTNHPNAIHALTCESIESPNRKAIVSWLTSPKRKAALVWANLVVENPDHITQLQTLVSEIRTKMSSSTVLMISIQRGFEGASIMSKNRRIAQNPRTTMGWSDEQEKALNGAVERCRMGKVFWVTHHAGPNGEEGGKS